MEEEFYATLKLVSGEEIVAKVCYLPDEDKILLEHPLQVETAKTKKGKLEVSGFTLKEWLSATFDDMFVISRAHVITMSELDSKIEEFYVKMLSKHVGEPNLLDQKNNLNQRMGYLGSIKEMKKSLEEIYKRS